MWPILFRYSRVIWMHADQVLDPRKPQAESENANPMREIG
jgi:hypothetical protein